MNKEELRDKIADTLNATEISVELEKADIYKFADALIADKFGRIINFAEYVGSKIAGHSNYHGDSILCALYCAAEGKEIHTVKPLDITEYGYNVVVQERDKYKHLAEKEEKLKNQYCRALLNLARRYVVKTNMTLPHGNEPNSRDVDIEMLALYIIANEREQAEKELEKERKDE